MRRLGHTKDTLDRAESVMGRADTTKGEAIIATFALTPDGLFCRLYASIRVVLWSPSAD